MTQPKNSRSKTQSTIRSVISSKRSEIIVVLKSIISNWSQNSLDDFGQIETLMFPDSANFGRLKLHYLFQFGLTKYYKEKYFHHCYLNQFSHQNLFQDSTKDLIQFQKGTKWMRVRYFDNLEEEIDCDFMPHAKTEQISKSRESVHEGLDLTCNLVQISMVAPNVDL